MNTISYRQKKGFTLIEIVLVLGVITALGAGIFSTYNKRHDAALANSQSKYLQIINKTVINGYGVTGNFAPLTPSNLIAQGIAPNEMINGTALNNVWGGDFNTGAATFGGSQGFFITLSQVPSSGCAKIASDVANDFMEMDINGVAIKTVANANVMINIATAAANCAPNYNTITLRNRQVVGADPVVVPTINNIPPLPASAYPGMVQAALVQPSPTTCVNGLTGAGPAGGTCNSCPNGGAWNGSFCVVCNVSPSYTGTTLAHEYVYNSALGRCV